MKVQILIPFFIYLLLLTLIGFITTRNVSRGMVGFYLGERKMNRFVIAISSVVSARGAWLLIGVTAQAYIMGLSSLWLVTGFILSDTLLFIFFAPVIRKYSDEHRCFTLTDIFASRFKDEKKTLRIIASAALLFFSLSFISSQFIAGGRAFYSLLGFTLPNGIIITGVIALLLVLPGGFKTLNSSDVLHAFIILIVLICIPILILIRGDGFGNLHTEIRNSSPDFFDLKAISLGTLIGFLSIGLGSAGNPNILVKFMSVSKPNHFKGMVIVNAITNIMMALAAMFTGVFARIYFPTSDAIPGADPQNLFIGLAGMVLPPLVLGLVLASILGSVISAAGSQVLVSASTIVSDLYEKTFKKGMPSSATRLKFYGRIAIVVMVYIAILAGIMIQADNYDFMLFAFAGLGASLGPAIIFTLTWKDVTNRGIMAGIITGALTVIVWKSIPVLSEHLYELAPGVILATFAIWIGSKIDKNLKSRKFNRQARYQEIKKAGLWE